MTSTGPTEGRRRTDSFRSRCWTRWSWPRTASGRLLFTRYGNVSEEQIAFKSSGKHLVLCRSDVTLQVYYRWYLLCSERLQREARSAAVPVHGVAGSRRPRASHAVPGLPAQSQVLQPAGRRTHGGALQV